MTFVGACTNIFLFLIGSVGKVEMSLHYHELSVDAVINAVVGTVISVTCRQSS